MLNPTGFNKAAELANTPLNEFLKLNPDLTGQALLLKATSFVNPCCPSANI